VRITQDVGEILGVDERTYELSAEDVVTLPAVNATPLLDRDAAEQL
jgi:DNA replication factor GINS